MVVDRWNIAGFWLTFLVLATGAGCGSGSSGPSPTPSDSDANSTSAAVPVTGGNVAQAAVSIERYDNPQSTVTQFLTVLKNGDQARAMSMLTVKAQQEMAKSEATIQPPGSSTAQFKVTKSEIVGDQQDGAHVLSDWTDTEEDGSTSTHEIVWILRHEATGWAVAGFATQVFEDQPPLILNFEDPMELQRKRTAVDAEIARRNEPQTVRQVQLPNDELRR